MSIPSFSELGATNMGEGGEGKEGQGRGGMSEKGQTFLVGWIHASASSTCALPWPVNLSLPHFGRLQKTGIVCVDRHEVCVGGVVYS